jgi:hypothetical protein
MFKFTMGTALQRQLDGLAQLRSALPGVIKDSLDSAGTSMVQDLASAAPRGQGSSGSSPEGDASGPLAESFTASVEETTLTVKTSQPTKLGYVTQGTGIYGAEHPVRSVAGMEPNDFVSPITDEAGSEINDEVSSAIYEALQEAADY